MLTAKIFIGLIVVATAALSGVASQERDGQAVQVGLLLTALGGQALLVFWP